MGVGHMAELRPMQRLLTARGLNDVQSYCGNCGDESQVDISFPKSTRAWLFDEMDGPGGTMICLGCNPGITTITHGPDVAYEMIWAYLAALEGL